MIKKDEAGGFVGEHRVKRKGLKDWQTLGYLRDSKKRLEKVANSWSVPQLSNSKVEGV